MKVFIVVHDESEPYDASPISLLGVFATEEDALHRVEVAKQEMETYPNGRTYPVYHNKDGFDIWEEEVL